MTCEACNVDKHAMVIMTCRRRSVIGSHVVVFSEWQVTKRHCRSLPGPAMEVSLSDEAWWSMHE